jgi:diguanylate cyclase (GGDEF)-like protein
MAGRFLDADDDAQRAVLDRLTGTVVSSLGCERAVIALCRPDGRLHVGSVVDDSAGLTAPVGSVVSRDLPRALGSGWTPTTTVLVPLRASDGSRLGVLAAGLGPTSEDVPDPTRRDALEAFAVAAGLAIEQAASRARADANGAALLNQARSDPLTGVGTRTLLLERLHHASTARTEGNASMALVFVDLDHFKSINDHHSHGVGDRVLRVVAERIQAAVRAHDTVARWGGDEFVVLLDPLADVRFALGAVQRVLNAVAEPVKDGPRTLRVTASIGVSLWSPGEVMDTEEMVRRADAAMYAAKVDGGDRFTVFDAADPDFSRRLHLHDLLSRAVTEDRVVVQYQPVVRVEDQRIVGVEALLRVRDDDGTLVYPLELLHRGAPPTDVASAVMMRACADMARWVEEGHDLWLSLNVSAQQVAAIDSLVEDVTRALLTHHLSPERLTLELTEHTLLNTTARTLVGIERLVAAGVGFSIDDFGTGYGSMTYLRTIPVHELKIDRSFVEDAEHHHAARAIVRSIASLADDLGIRCVAEGVQTLEHHTIVEQAGVPLAQGLRYGDALGAEELLDLLEPAAR